ncbi:LysR family transcriptional regulator [Tenggerimyces flavus]|uniref:LysR family transcriptional regulator n=1 Tax=Tenggerimyces flavus TaxID=1708749 RepID=A0ABV7YFY2_9ACTN|nr:LysR family transcriptional regulator [Tenggerimyces flavus]MBM7784285.1 DNA-binding transcriptional LysR family regulator [Tenggerimyces flavus]
MLNLERLRVLHAVSSTGSVRGAAEWLHVTTSAVSQQIDRLEREVGQPLVERQGRGVRLTEAGVVLAAHAASLLAEVERVEADLAERAGAVVGRVTVAAFATAARGLLPSALRSLRTTYSRLTVRLTELEPTDALPLLLRGEVDVAVVQDWAEAPLDLPDGLATRDLLSDVLDAALPSSHPLADKESIGLADLAGSDWVMWTSGQICNSWIEDSLRSEGVRPDVIHTASEHSTQLALVAAGVGVAIIPRLGREPVPADVRIVPTSPPLTRRVFAVWRASTTRRPTIGAVLDALTEAASDPGRS